MPEIIETLHVALRIKVEALALFYKVKTVNTGCLAVFCNYFLLESQSPPESQMKISKSGNSFTTNLHTFGE